MKLLLQEGGQVRVLSRSESKLRLLADFVGRPRGSSLDGYVGDIRDPDAIYAAMKGIAVLFHCCHTHEYWRGNHYAFDVNVAATKRLLTLAAGRGCRVIFTGSRNSRSSECSRQDRGLSLEKRAEATTPCRLYNSLTKAWATEAVKEYQEKGLTCRVLYVPYLIGSGDFAPTPLRLAVPWSLAVGLKVAPKGGCSIAGAESAAQAHVDVWNGVIAERETYVAGMPILYRELFALLNRLAGRYCTPKVLPPELLGLLARGKVFGKWSAQRMSAPIDSSDDHELGQEKREELDRILRGALGWFRYSSSLRSLSSLMRYSVRFL